MGGRARERALPVPAPRVGLPPGRAGTEHAAARTGRGAGEHARQLLATRSQTWSEVMDRLRAAYVALDPGIEQHLVAGSTDDEAGIERTYVPLFPSS